MAKMVGFACSIRLQWLNMAAQLTKENLTEAEFKERVNEYLSFEIESPTRLRKTREILMNIWYYESEEMNSVRKEAISLIDKYPEYSSIIHLCMIYLVYPVVADICRFIGRISEFQNEITNATLKQKLYDAWGERGTLETTSRRVTLTLKELDLLRAETKTRYVINKIKVPHENVVNFLLSLAMKIENDGYYTMSQLKDFSILFPVEMNISREQLMADERFAINNFGGEMSVSLKEERA